ncbi:hypothetical protein SDJN02_10603, partial [Cucurbita argyrosperma subsp. argyrosperma]
MAVRFATDRWTRLFSLYLCNSTQPVLQHKNTKYRRELEAAVDVVQRAFRILVDEVDRGANFAFAFGSVESN